MLRVKVPNFYAHCLFWGLSLIGFVADIWSKEAVFKWLIDKPYQRVSIVGDFISFRLAENAGAAFSMAHGQRFFLVATSFTAFVAIIFAFEIGVFKTLFSRMIASLFFAGVSGNLYDRLFNDGRVRDFIDVNLYINNYHWPTFNIADSLLCVAVGFCLWDAFKNKENKKCVD